MIPALIAGAAALGAAGIGAISSGIQNSQNLGFQQANLDYQKAMQQKIFEREDTAIQRRKRDLEAAGFNPYLAMNQNGANAGQVVSTQPKQSNFDTSQFSSMLASGLGTAVDMLKSLEDIKQQRLYTNYMALQNESLRLNNLDFGNYLDSLWLYNGGEKWELYDYRKPYSPSMFAKVRETSTGFLHSIYGAKSLPLEYAMLENSKHISDVTKNFALSDKIEGYIMDGIDALLGGSNSARGWYDSYNKAHQPPRLQNYREDYQRNSKGYIRERKYY